MYIIIPLGGKGERFSKNGYKNPKPLIKVLNKEIISYLLDNIVENTNEDDQIYIIYNKDLQLFKFDQFIKEKYPNIKLIKLNNQTKGAVETVKIGIQEILNSESSILDHNCLLLDGDTFYNIDIINKLIEIKNNKCNAIFYFKEFENANKDKPLYSYIDLDDNKKVLNIKEKVKISNNANIGAYYFDDILELLNYADYVIKNDIRFKNEYYTSCLIKEMLNDKKDFIGIELKDDEFCSLGTPDQVETFINETFAYLFDLDGTLIYSENVYYKVWYDILKEYNIEITHDIFNKYISGNNDETVIKILIPNIKKDNIISITEKKDELFLRYIDDVELIEDAIEFIKNIRLKKYKNKIAIVTNCNRKVAEEIINKFEFNKYIDCLIISNECKNPKPYPDPYLKALDMLGISNKKAVIFEDSKSGILSAKGIYPLAIIGLETSLTKTEFLEAGVTKTIKNYSNFNFFENNVNSSEIIELKNVIRNNLSDTYNITDIIINETKLKGGYIADIISLIINLKNDDCINCILKMENNSENLLKDMAKNLNLYNREYYFYEHISKYVNICIPKFYHILKDDDFISKGILLENLNKENFTLNLDLNKETIDISLTIIERMTKMHSKFWNKNLKNIFEKLKKTNDPMFYPSMSEFIKENWNSFKNKWSNILSDNQIKIGDKIVSNIDYIQQYLGKDNLTLCHGDVKSANIFYKKLDDNLYEPYFIDWQYVNNGKGVSDIVFFMIESFDILTIKTYNDIFKEYYYIKLLEYDIKSYNKDTYIKDFKIASCFYPFFVGIWFGNIKNEDLIDVNFPFFYIQKLFHFLEINKCDEFDI
jgi:HAD superfamily hydrolase (TIGR01509 family)